MNNAAIMALVVVGASLAGIGAAQQPSSDALEPTDHLSTTPPVDGNLTMSGEIDRFGFADHYLILDDWERVTVTLTNFGSEELSLGIAGGERNGFYAGGINVAPGSTGSTSFQYNPSVTDWSVFGLYLTGTPGTEYEIEVVSETDQLSPTPTPTPTPEPEPPRYYQIDLVEGEPIERLDPEAGDTYHKQDRFIHALHIAEGEGNRGGFATNMWRTYESGGCEVAYTDLGFRSTDGRASVDLEVSDIGGCENITLSLVGYELPEGTTDWDPDRADEQELKDSMTRTLTPGDRIVFSIDVIDEERPTPTPVPTPAPPTHYQIDFVEGEPIERLDPEAGDTYHRQGRFITALHVAEDDSSWGGPGGGPGYLPRLTYPSNYSSDGCNVHYTWRSFNPNTGKSRVDAMVEDVGGCEEITLTYAGYELPEGTTGWDADRADEQELKDSMTRTLTPGDVMTFIVYVFDEEPPTTTGTFDVVDVSAPDVAQGETANVTATIENTGDTAGTQKVRLSTEGAAARGASKLDIVFVVDDSANMWPEMEDAKEHVRNFSSQLDRADVDARYALVSFTDEPDVDQAYTSNVSEFQESVDRLTPTEDGTHHEDAWDAIHMALELEAREDSTPVVILITDGPAYYKDVWHDSSDLTRSQVASLIDEANASLFTVTSLESSNDVASPEGDTTALASDVADGTHFDLVKYDYGGPISDEIAAELIERSRTRAVSLALAPGESTRVSYSVSTDDVPPGTYNITVSTENDAESTTLTVTN